MLTKLDKQEDTTIVAEAAKKKIRSTLACTSSFLAFFTIIHSRGQRYVVPLQNSSKQKKYTMVFIKMPCVCC